MIGLLSDIWSAVSASTTFSILKGFLALYVLFLVADIIMLLILRPIAGDLKKSFYGTKERILSSSSSIRKRWMQIESLLGSVRSSDWKLAVLRADEFLDSILKEMGYEGDGMGERLQYIQPEQFASASGLREAHEVRNRIVLEESLTLDNAEARRVVGLYRDFLVETETL